MTDPIRPAGQVSAAPVSAVQIADALGLPRPTPQQIAVIEAAPDAPALVIAGAGSGKTETMANRVLWLLANGFVTPEQILGLTFTRKAAGELAERIRTRIAQLVEHGLLPGEYDPFAEPTVATYNSFANSIYGENAALLGRDAEGPVLGEAAAWQLARSAVLSTDDPRLPDLDKNLEPLTNAVLELSRSMSENVVDPDELTSFAAEFSALADLPLGAGGNYRGAKVDGWVATVGALGVLVDLAADYEAEKFRRSAVEYSDQVAFALQIVESHPAIAAELRDRFRVVLLDEYQDTSVVQTRLLARMFAGHSVMAVGDPNQSIYGWRGASAANLPQFPAEFGVTDQRFVLATSWRNGTRILAAANEIVAPFAGSLRVTVPRLEPSPTASDHELDVIFDETVDDEALHVAEWFAQNLGTIDAPVLDAAGKHRTAAILFRARKTQSRFLAALHAKGVRYHVLGVGGLLAEPEVADLVSALRVMHDPSAGFELVRLLAGSRWRVGASDLHALRSVASWLRERDDSQQRYDDETRVKMRESVAAGDGGSIVDALDFVATAPAGHSQLEEFSEVGIERLRDAGATMARLRARGGFELPDLVSVVEQELRLDIEVAANEFRPLGGSAMEAFSDALQGYLSLAEVATLGGFLTWLRAAEQKEDLSPRPEPPEPGTVQVLTVHGAKGLEWDLVAVPRMVDGELPANPLEGTTGWLGFGRLPWEFRGDAPDLPKLSWRGAESRKDLEERVAVFQGEVGDRAAAEERRLAYVAVTRARHRLLLSGSFWATQTKPRPPSVFLRELEAAGIIGPLPTEPVREDPLEETGRPFHWPADPLGERRRAVEAAAEAVAGADPVLAGPWADDVTLLLAERAARLASAGRIPLPTRVPASRFKDFVTDPDAVAGSMLRPMPERPYKATRLGTLFHAWVEQRFGIVGGSDELDAESFELDGEQNADTAPEDAAALAALQETFSRSEWATRRPIEVEREIHLPFAGRIVICKIDAIYRDRDGDADRFEVVDWKTGKAPKDADDLERKQLQLALYRLAYAKWTGIDPAQIDAAFYFVSDDRVIRPDHIDSEAELLARWNAAFPSS